MDLDAIKIGFALTGSFCTISKVVPIIKELKDRGADIMPIFSKNVSEIDSRFGKAKDLRDAVEEITGKKIITTIDQAEPIGPKNLLDVMAVAPCTGNTLSKIAQGITDTSVTMAVKATLRNNHPVLLAVSTNDGLSGSARNIGQLLNTKNIYFVPFGQDDCIKKETSLVAKMDDLIPALEQALEGKQMQPLLK